MQINPAINMSTLAVGREKTTVIVIDDVLRESTSVRDFASQIARFAPDNVTAYPGIRAPLPDWFIDRLMDYICPIFRRTYNVPDELTPSPVMAYLSLLTTPADELNLLQRMPHFDSVKDTYFSLVLYLNEGNFGGTGFFRHRPTGFERILDHRYDGFVLAGKSFTSIYGQPAMKYINTSDPHFELIEAVT